jgi:hypothetical protein
MAADELRGWYEEAARDACERAKAILDEAARKVDARRRFNVDSQGCAVIAYVVAPADDEEAPA